MNRIESFVDRNLLITDGIIEVMSAAEEIPFQNIEDKKKLLRLSLNQISEDGKYRYDLVLGRERDMRDSYLLIKFAPSVRMGAGFNEIQEVEFSEKINKDKFVLRVGYLKFDKLKIREMKAIGNYSDTDLIFEDILGLHFADYYLNTLQLDGCE